MSFIRIAAIVSVSAIALGACTPRSSGPDPVTPEPVYDKYGNAVATASCREAGAATTSANQRLPECAPPVTECGPNERAGTNAKGETECVPARRQRDENDGGQGGGRGGNQGGGATAG